MSRKTVQISLEDDTAEFLELARSATAQATISDFINSLLRQERFRQGFPAHQGSGQHKGVLSLADKILAKRRSQ